MRPSARAAAATADRTAAAGRVRHGRQDSQGRVWRSGGGFGATAGVDLSGAVHAAPPTLASLAAVVPERAASDAAREVCSRGSSAQGRELPPLSESALLAATGGEVEPCSFETEVEWIVRYYARQIDGVRQTIMPRDLIEAAIRAVRDSQRATLAAMRERRQWWRQRPARELRVNS